MASSGCGFFPSQYTLARTGTNERSVIDSIDHDDGALNESDF